MQECWKASKRRIQDAIEEIFLEPLIEEHTNLLTNDFPTMMTSILHDHGKVRSEEVTQKDSDAMLLACKPTDPIILLTRPIENIQNLAKQAGIPCANSQILEKGLVLMRSTRDFECALQLCEKKSSPGKTWAEFKTYFHDAQHDLKKIRGPTMHQTGCYHAN